MPPNQPAPKRKSYLVLVGMNYQVKGGDEVRREPGDVADDIPLESLRWLVDQGVITEDLDHLKNAEQDIPDSAPAIQPDEMPTSADLDEEH